MRRFTFHLQATNLTSNPTLFEDERNLIMSNVQRSQVRNLGHSTSCGS